MPIDINNITVRDTTGGDPRVTTLNGDIALEQNRGRLVVYDPITNKERTIQDINGFQVNNPDGDKITMMSGEGTENFDSSGNVITKQDEKGFRFFDGADESARFGKMPDGTTNIIIMKKGKDVETDF